jgi:hypothetical protein
VAADEAEAEAAGEDAALDALGELAADEDELEEELQPTAASPMKASPTTANRARVDRYVNMMPTIAIVTCGTQPDMSAIVRTVTCYSLVRRPGLA